jgi:hypothetical protein
MKPREFLVLMLLTVLSMSVLWKVPIVSAAEVPKNMSRQSYVLEDGIEKSRRSYLLVYEPEKDTKRQVSVVSECEKPFQEEGVYGKCKHHISVAPTGKVSTVETGEDVVMIATAWDMPLILGTIDYGCCAAPLSIAFYKEDGERLGALKKPPRALHSLYGNTITRLWDLGNSAGRYGKTQFFVTQDDHKDDLFYALKKESGSTLSKVPILYKNANEAKCDEWFLGDFVKSRDQDEITFILEGFFCNNGTEGGYEKKLYSCYEKDKGIECSESR